MPTDPFKANGGSSSSFGRSSRIITPGASDIDPIPKCVVCLTAGDITVVPVDNANADELVFVGVAAGYVVPFQIRRVTAATAAVATIEG